LRENDRGDDVGEAVQIAMPDPALGEVQYGQGNLVVDTGDVGHLEPAPPSLEPQPLERYLSDTWTPRVERWSRTWEAELGVQASERL
jgi:hypothetical protein